LKSTGKDISGKLLVMRLSKRNKYQYLFACLIAFCLWSSIAWGFPRDNDPSIRFLGAARAIGGSCYLVDTGKTRVLIDFGLYPGEEAFQNNDIAFDPSTIDFVLLTHAHIDHAGRLPLLYRRGFTGKTLGTDATRSLLEVTLKMSLDASEKQGVLLYNYHDYRRMMKNFQTVPYDQRLELNDDVSVRFRHSGHILGAAIIELWIKTTEGLLKIVATGDMGNESQPLLKKPEIIQDADYVLVESTQGPIKRSNTGYTAFGKEIRKTLNAGGSVLIPTFVLDRTQNVLYVIGVLKQSDMIPRETPVYVDSRTAQKITGIYRKYSKYFGQEAAEHLESSGDPFSFQSSYHVSPREALRKHDSGRPAIYISSSAMLDHANAPKHLLKMIENQKNLLAIVGWQAPGTPGWKLQRGDETIRIPIEQRKDGKGDVKIVEKTVKMKVMTFDMFSYHADGCQILTWLSNFAKLKQVFVVHGEKDNAIGMAKIITEKLGFKATAPERGEVAYLSVQGKTYDKHSSPNLCSGMENPSARDGLPD
jgi:metallo-beta-lactamase family protein